MLTNESTYLNLLRDVYENGSDRPDRTNTGVRGVFGRQTRYDLSSSLPLLTTKKMEIKSIVSELLWFIEGSGDERRLAEIRFGKPRDLITDKRTIWTDNAESPYWATQARFPGDLGRVYGVQWRKWRTPLVVEHLTDKGEFLASTSVDYEEVDQLANLIEGLRSNPFGRRHILTSWNPGEIDEMALPPCHILSQFYVDSNKLSCMLTQRSNDLFLGSPYNIASYAIFTIMLAQITGFKPGELVYSQGDVHIYHNHMDAVAEQLSREPLSPGYLYVDPTITEIGDFKLDSFEVMGYNSHPSIRAKMAI